MIFTTNQSREQKYSEIILECSFLTILFHWLDVFSLDVDTLYLRYLFCVFSLFLKLNICIFSNYYYCTIWICKKLLKCWSINVKLLIFFTVSEWTFYAWSKSFLSFLFLLAIGITMSFFWNIFTIVLSVCQTGKLVMWNIESMIISSKFLIYISFAKFLFCFWSLRIIASRKLIFLCFFWIKNHFTY